jgi:TonB family protein
VLESARFWVFTLIAVSLSHSQAQSATDTPEISSNRPVQISKVKPEFPYELRNTVYHRGFARVVFMVDEAGNSYDFVLLEATHPLFGTRALEALSKWKVTPPIVDGQPCPTRHVITVEFSQEEPVIIDRPIGETGRSGERIQNRSLYYRVCGLGDLDRLPRRIETVDPVLPEGVSADAASGIARMVFFIDKEGRVRAPDVLFSTNDVIANAAITAIPEWRFEPPIKKGDPVVVRAVQTIHFKAPEVK